MTTIVSQGSLVTAKALDRLEGTLTTSPSSGTVPLFGVEQYTDRMTGETIIVSRSATYDLMYRRQPALYAVSTLLMKALARLPMKAYEMGPDNKRERLRAHPSAKMVRKPYKRGAAWDWKIRLAYDLFVHGRHLQVKLRDNKRSTLKGFLPVPWNRVGTVEDDLGYIHEYHVYEAGRIHVLTPEDVVYHELPGGVSPVEVLRRTLALEDAATTYQGASLQNGITPRAAFSFKGGVNPKDRDYVRDQIKTLYAGPHKASDFAVLPGDASVTTIGVSAVDLALIEQRKLSRDECCAAYNISPSIVGWTGEKAATFASAKEFHRALYIDALGPVVTMVEETMQAQLIDEEGAWDGVYVEFDMNELMRPDIAERMRAYLMAQQSSTSTIDERRGFENLPTMNIPGITDVPLIPVNMVPAAKGAFDGRQVSEGAAQTANAITEQLVREAIGPQDEEEDRHA